MAEVLTTSIALCTFNGAAFLEEQLASLAAQTRLPGELVVGDDGSRDATLAILERFAVSAPFPVRIERNPINLGYRANFVGTAARCSGALILFCDQDDVWAADKIARMSEAFAHPEVLLAYHDAALFDGAGAELGRLYDPEAQRAAIAQQPLPPWHYSLGFTQAFRRELLAWNDLWPASRDYLSGKVMAHDQWYIFLALALGQVAYVDAPLVRHRQHRGNVYGVVRTSAWRRLTSRFSHTPDWDRLADAAASARAQALAGIAGRSAPEPAGGGRAARLLAAAALYRDLAARHRRRYASYMSPTLPARARAFSLSLARRDYAGKPWGLGRPALGRDLAVGVLKLGHRGS